MAAGIRHSPCAAAAGGRQLEAGIPVGFGQVAANRKCSRIIRTLNRQCRRDFRGHGTIVASGRNGRLGVVDPRVYRCAAIGRRAAARRRCQR